MESRPADALPVPTAAAALVVHPLTCGRCGGVFEADAKVCPYCGGGIALEDRRLAGVCPVCGSRLADDAKFCKSCGREVALQPLAGLRANACCPRCSASLRTRNLGTVEVTECSSCGGLWLSPGLLEELCTGAEKSALVRTALDAAPPALRPADADEARYLPCVACGDLMVRRNFGGSSGILIDVCRNHGVWLDDRELQRVLDFVRAGGLERKRALDLEHERRVRLEGDGPAPLILEDRADRETFDLDLGDALVWLARTVGGLFAR